MESHATHPLRALLPFWAFVLAFKIGGGLHYALASTLGSQVFPVWVVGLIVGAGAFVQLVLDLPIGGFLDRNGYVRSLRWATVFFLASAAALIGGVTQGSFIASIFLSTFAWLVFTPGIEAYILARAPQVLAGRYVAMREVCLATGTVLAMLLLTTTVRAPISVTVLTIATPFLAAIVALSIVPHEEGPMDPSAHPATRIRRRRHGLRESFAAFKRLNPASGLLALLGMVASTFYSIVWFVFPLAVVSAVSSEADLFGLGIFDLSVILFGALIGWLADRVNKRRLAFLGLLLFGVAATVLGMHLDAWFALFGFLASMGHELASVSLWAWMSVLNTEHEGEARVAGLITAADDIGWMAGPILGGFLFEGIGAGWTISLSGALILLAWVIAVLALRHPSARSLATARPLPERPKHARSQG